LLSNENSASVMRQGMSRLAKNLPASQELSFINSLTKLITFSSARLVSRWHWQ